MFQRFRSRRVEQAAIERLREEAQQTRPAFSEDLHRRLRASLPEVLATTPARTARPRLAWGAAALALLLVCLGLVWHGLPGPDRRWHRELAPRDFVGAAGLAALPESAHRGAEEVERLAAAILTWPAWAGLDQDAQLAARSLAQCFPLRSSRLPDPVKSTPVE